MCCTGPFVHVSAAELGGCMSTKNESSTLSVVDLARTVGANQWGRLRIEGDRQTGTSTTAKQHQVEHDDPLPSNDFLKHLNREKRRSERSNAALSIVLYRINANDGFSAKNADCLLEVLHAAKRETDVLGHVGDDMIAVLCPDTDDVGTKAFVRKIADQAGALPIQATAATYPDQIFENLTQPVGKRPAFQPFLVSEVTNRPDYSLKRGLDIVGSLIAFIMLGPLMLVTAAAIFMSSRGPVLFKQTRLGKNGVPFTFYKFRSMLVNVDDSIHRQFVADLIKSERPAQTSAIPRPASYKLQSDPRITPLGRFIRKTSIDELPQLFNVLKGEMSLVGPRPPIPYETENYQSWHLRRLLTLRPGITGLWQVEGRSRVTFNEMVRMDLRYIRNCSLVLDMKILLKTVLVVFRGTGAT